MTYKTKGVNKMKIYYDETFGKKLFVCNDGCSTGRLKNLVEEQCDNNIEKKCMFLIHNEHCICNKKLVKTI